MEKRGKIVLSIATVIFAIVMFFIIVSHLSYVIAVPAVNASSGTFIGNNFSAVNEDVTNFYNISINNTDGGATGGNITKVNITLPSGFTFLFGTNKTNSPGNFTNTTNSLIWENVTMLINASGGPGAGQMFFFSFNATAVTPGSYNFTIITHNNTAIYHNLSVVINDTTRPSDIAMVAPGLSINGRILNVTNAALYINTSIVDNSGNGTGLAGFYGNGGFLQIYLYNLTGLRNSTNFTGPGGKLWNTTGLHDGTFRVNITVNDTTGNNASFSFPVVMDNTAPSATLTKSTTSTTKTTLVVDISVSDTTSGIASTMSCTSDRPDGSVTGSGTSQTFTENNLNCGSSTSVTITCTDHAGLTGQTTGSFTTLGCSTSSASGGGGGGSGSSTSTTTWANTFAEDSSDLTTLGSVSRDLKERERVKISLDGETHHIGVVDGGLSDNSATIEVASHTPIEIALSIGATEKFELTHDEFYDISVTLNSITNDKASFTVTSINEEIISAAEEEQATGEEAESEPDLAPPTSSAAAGGSTVWIIVTIVVVIVIILFFWLIKKRK